MTPPRNVLLVDDNPDDRALASRALRAAFPGVQCLEVGTEPGFARALDEGGFDAVVTDHQLLWSDGLQVLRAIRQRYPEVPVVMFTNTGSEEVCAEGMREGLHDYVLKRAHHYVLLPAAVRSGLEMVAARRAVRQHQAALEQAVHSERQARQRAEQADRLKDEFLATLSHELRTPLNAIIGWAHVLQKAPTNAATVAKGAEVIERNVKAQARIIEDLLDVSTIVSGKLRLERRPVELIPVLEAAIESVMQAAQDKGVALERTLDARAGAVMGDATRLQQVVWNLLVNAVKFTPAGGRVHVMLECLEDTLQVTVSDNGEGMSADFLPHAFERLRQADGSSTRRHSGLGLGLAIVKQLVELQDGTVEAHSAGLGQGCEFVVRFPVADPTERRQRVAAPVPPAQPAVSLAGARLLVVDDEADARTLMQELLGDRGAEVTLADSAAQAVALYQARRPDLLISDIGMPGEDGYSLIGRLRKLDEGGPRVPAIALTAFARAEDRQRALLAGFQFHIPKPVDPAELVAAIASLLGRT